MNVYLVMRNDDYDVVGVYDSAEVAINYATSQNMGRGEDGDYYYVQEWKVQTDV